MPEVSSNEWDNYLSQNPDAHLLQTSTWGILKSSFGWRAKWLLMDKNSASVGAQILFKALPLGLTLAYIPKGPLVKKEGVDWTAWEQFWPEVDSLCRQQHSVFLKVEPDIWQTSVSANQNDSASLSKSPKGFQVSQQDIQPARTLLVELHGSEEQILGRMKQKTRYNIRLALKRGVVVRTSSDLDTFYRLMQITAQRDSFGVHSLAYYQRAYELFHPRGECELLIAEYKGEPLAGLMVFARGSRSWYFYGASASEHRQRMPTYLLQWEAMRWARSQGCTVYDLWGVPDADLETLEANFTQRSDGLWGVYRFKRGFGGQLARTAGPWDRVYNPLLYALYRLWARRKNKVADG